MRCLGSEDKYTTKFVLDKNISPLPSENNLLKFLALNIIPLNAATVASFPLAFNINKKLS